jgi:glutaminyl-tRNA synthetase
LYELSGKASTLNDEQLTLVIKYILESKIDSKIRLTEGIKFLSSQNENTKLTELVDQFDSSIGLGIFYTDGDILSKIESFMISNNVTDWSNWGKTLGLLSKDMKWADKGNIKLLVDDIFLNKFGPKSKYVKNKKTKKSNGSNSSNKVTEFKVVNSLTSIILYDPKDNSINTKERLKEHLAVTGGKVVTRFPPEPNGYLHVGHCKAAYINFGYAKEKNGICYLRFDDTNPKKESNEYVESITEDIDWLGHCPWKITYTSDYFDELIEFAKKLIEENKAYICELPFEQIKKDRFNSVDSPFRNRSPEENNDLFSRMILGEFDEGEYVLRLKIDMNSDNPNMRDPVAYRIINHPHPRTLDKYKIYPSYDYSHCIVDSLENITHSMCTMEFQTRNEVYQWVLATLDIYRPQQIEYIRLKMTNVLLSKRKLIKLIEDGVVSGWDDPRLPTIKGLKRRGYTKESILDFCNLIGVNFGGSGGIVKMSRLEKSIRDLNINCERRMVVQDPLKVIIVNHTTSIVRAKNYPQNGETSSTREINATDVIYIDRSDFSLMPPIKYKRLVRNGVVRLKYAFPIRHLGEKIVDDIIQEIYVEKIENDNIKIPGTITWVPDNNANNSVKDSVSSVGPIGPIGPVVIIREYEYLFPTEFDESKDWESQINLDPVKESKIYIEPNMYNSKFDTNNTLRYQFERIGYFVLDKDSTDNHLIFNKIVDLKEAKNKLI